MRALYLYIETLNLGFRFEVVSFGKVLRDLEASLEAEELHPRAVVHIREIIDGI